MSAKKISRDSTKDDIASFFGGLLGIVFCVCAIALIIGFTFWMFNQWGLV